MRLKATTIIEVIVSMLLIIISISIVSTFFMNMLRTDAINAENTARVLCLAMASETKTLQLWESHTKEQPPFRLEQRANVFYKSNFCTVWELQISAFGSQNLLLFTHRELVHVAQNAEKQ